MFIKDPSTATIEETSKTLRMKNSDDQLIDIGTKLNFKEIDCSIVNSNPEAE